MEVRELNLPTTNKLTLEYMNKSLQLDEFFHYSPFEISSYKERLEELLQYNFPRKELVDHLLSYNQQYNAGKKTINNIKKLLEPNSVVVIGGQQAGLLTGPLYTIYKIVTILHQAKDLEREMDIPVIPVFWIAGEDHDFEEINHIFTANNNQHSKISIKQRQFNKSSVSQLNIDKEACQSWIADVFSTFGETSFTKKIIETIQVCLDSSQTYVDFFALLILQLFKETGIVLVDSGNHDLRKIETSFFRDMIKNGDIIDKSLSVQQEKMMNYDYQPIIQTEKGNAHLFYHLNENRILLERMVRGKEVFFRGKHNECEFSINELLQIAENFPEKLSNNVVTRPLMQELLFPTLSFVAGPGEIAYWAEVKGVFEGFSRKLPPVYPRLAATFVERYVHADLDDIGISMNHAILYGVNDQKEAFVSTLKNQEVNNEIQYTKELLAMQYEKFSKLAEEIHDSMVQITCKNKKYHLEQLQYLETEFFKQIQRNHDVTINKYDRVHNSLHPNNQPQERLVNVFYFINKYGMDFVDRLYNSTDLKNNTHKVIFI